MVSPPLCSMSRAILAVEVLIMNKVCEKDGMLET